MKSPLFRIIDDKGKHFYCDVDWCGSNMFMFDEGDGWLCNSCLTPPRRKPGIKFQPVHNQPLTETEAPANAQWLPRDRSTRG